MNLSATACVTVCAGRSGSGKTTFAIRYLLNVMAAARFVFDDRGQVASRLRITPAGTARELEAALASQWIVFNPHRMFPGNLEAAFAFFCQWCFEASTRGPGKKVLLVDEVWRWCTPYAIPQELANVVQTGRIHELEFFCCTQRPHRLNGAITNEITELVLFSLQEPAALDWCRAYGVAPDRIAGLEKGAFIAFDLDKGGEHSARLW